MGKTQNISLRIPPLILSSFLLLTLLFPAQSSARVLKVGKSLPSMPNHVALKHARSHDNYKVLSGPISHEQLVIL